MRVSQALGALLLGSSGTIVTREQRERYWREGDAIKAVKQLIRDACADVVKAYESSIRWEELFGDHSCKWVGAFLEEYRDFWLRELGEAEHRETQAEEFWHRMSMADLNERELDDLCRLRASMVIDRLEELPATPNPERRRERFRSAYGEFRQLRDSLAGRPGSMMVLEECYKTMQKVAALLGVEIPIHWYE